MSKAKATGPTQGELQRASLAYQLKIRGISLDAVAIETDTSASLVSRVLCGERYQGEDAKRVQAHVARLLKKKVEEIFVARKGETD